MASKSNLQIEFTQTSKRFNSCQFISIFNFNQRLALVGLGDHSHSYIMAHKTPSKKCLIRVVRCRPLPKLQSIGNFDRLPREMMEEIFERLAFNDLGRLAMTSERMRVYILNWSTSKSCLKKIGSGKIDKKFISASFTGWPLDRSSSFLTDLLKGYSAYATLVKRLTCLLNTRERLQLSEKLFSLVLRHQPEDFPSNDWKLTLTTIRYAVMLNTLTRGWDDSEFSPVFEMINIRFGISEVVKRVFIQSSLGDYEETHNEMTLRLVVRCLAWDFAGSDYRHRAMMLFSFFERFVDKVDIQKCSNWKQAMFFTLLFGSGCPESTGHYTGKESVEEELVMKEIFTHTDWDSIELQSNVPNNFRDGKESFYSMAQAICSCYTAFPTWGKDYLSTFLTHLFESPADWGRESTAAFLLFCSEKLIEAFLKSKLSLFSESSSDEVATILLDMIIMASRFENRLVSGRGIGKIFDDICLYAASNAGKMKDFTDTFCKAVIREYNDNMITDSDELLDLTLSIGLHISERVVASLSTGDQGSLKSADLLSNEDASEE